MKVNSLIRYVVLACLYIIGFNNIVSAEFEAVYTKLNSTIVISGDLSDYDITVGDMVTLVLKNKMNSGLGYINQTMVKSDGTYECKFRFSGNVSDYNLAVRYHSVDATKSVKSAVQVNDKIIDIPYSIEKQDGMHYLYSDLRERYDGVNKITPIVVIYENGVLNKVVIDFGTEGLIYENGGYSFKYTLDDYRNKTVKFFIWESFENMIPLARTYLQDGMVVSFGDMMDLQEKEGYTSLQ